MYEIPQQLEYKEKIVFGLTFGQLMYAMIFIPIAIIFFRLNVPLPLKIFLSAIPCVWGAGFMFFDFSGHIKNWYVWYKFRKLKDLYHMEKFFLIQEIKDNFIYLK